MTVWVLMVYYWTAGSPVPQPVAMGTFTNAADCYSAASSYQSVRTECSMQWQNAQ